MELPSLTRSNVLIGAVQRGDHDNVTIPGGAFRLEAGDRIMLISTPHSAQTFFRQLKLGASRIRQVLIVGGGRIAYYLARQLLESGLDVKIIESNFARCEQLSQLLPKATILHGDGTNEAFLRESGVEQVDAFASLTGMDEEKHPHQPLRPQELPARQGHHQGQPRLVPEHPQRAGRRQRL